MNHNSAGFQASCRNNVLVAAMADLVAATADLVAATAGNGRVEARSTSKIFRFVDDIVVRVVPAPDNPEHSIVDIRSRSRDGRGDLGANAARIRAFTQQL